MALAERARSVAQNAIESKAADLISNVIEPNVLQSASEGLFMCMILLSPRQYRWLAAENDPSLVHQIAQSLGLVVTFFQSTSTTDENPFVLVLSWKDDDTGSFHILKCFLFEFVFFFFF
jgi:hypothetical protein